MSNPQSTNAIIVASEWISTLKRKEKLDDVEVDAIIERAIAGGKSLSDLAIDLAEMKARMIDDLFLGIALWVS